MQCCHCGNHEVGTGCTIPKAPFYVTSMDSFMSGWGPATGKKNVCVVACSTREMAERVLRYVKSRNEQKNARITTFRPGEGPTVLLTNLVEWIKTSKQNGF